MGQVLKLAKIFRWAWWHDVAVNQAPTCGRRRSGRRCGGRLVCERCGEPMEPVRNDPGWPDLFLVRDEDLVIAELKRDGEEPTPEQRGWLRAFAAVRRVRVEVWRPRDVDAVTKLLR